MKTIVIFAVVVVLMAVVAYLVVTMFLAPHGGPPKLGEKTKPALAKESAGNPGKGKGEIFMVEELLVNPAGTSGTRYLSASLGLEAPNHEVAVRLEENKLRVRDLLISILSSRTVEQLTNAGERERMRLEILDRLNQMVQPDRVLAVYFVDYVLQ